MNFKIFGFGSKEVDFATLRPFLKVGKCFETLISPTNFKSENSCGYVLVFSPKNRHTDFATQKNISLPTLRNGLRDQGLINPLGPSRPKFDI